jgi:hypothetical protein
MKMRWGALLLAFSIQAYPALAQVGFEAETAPVTQSGTGTTLQNDANTSGGQWISLDAEANAADWYQFTTPSVPAGTYTLALRYKTNNNRGRLTTSVDGVALAGTVDQYATPSTYPTATLGTVTFALTGTHTIRLTVAGKAAASSSYVLSADRFILTPSGPPPTPEPGFVKLTPVAVSASVNDGNVPANAIDGNLATRWSGNGEGASLTLDLGSEQTVGFVKLAVYQGNGRQNRFDLQVSSDGASWSNVLTNATTSTTTQLQTIEFGDVLAGHVRYVGHGNTVNMFSSLTEVEVWGSACTSCPTPIPPTPTPTPTGVPPTATPTPTPTQGGGGSPVTEGWTQRSWTYTMHKPYNQELSNRFSYSNGVWTCWLFPNDPPFQPPPKTGGPRTELRWQNDYTSGQRMWDADLWVVSPTQSTIMQLFGGSESSTSFQIRSFSDGTIKRYNSGLLMSNAFGKWINAKIAHNVSTHRVRQYINDELIREDPDRGPPSNVGAYYFKNGLYGCSQGRCESRFRNLKQWTR